ncbi:MAG: argininosuccinate lyase [Candidatus Odinarchaeum yellowstonii]|uniref:Argininosuccinate lyase n=1 Tax=Odinarchaeota yellowstonii (strain LCB_4) TaxID=1841599 RepID=A0AAF0D1H0_ODILC|nr:MAG: argininosuccinate lyase [Candidatus Odinarchaeum yellowstonii]
MSFFWRARFDENTFDETLDYTAGEDIRFDEKLVLYDILGTQAHNIMLFKIGLLKESELKNILKVLEDLKKEFSEGKIQLRKDYEDVHLNIEYLVTERIGRELGGKIHLARSRNDQVAVDIRMYMRDAVIALMEGLIEFSKILLKISEENYETLMPGYTHMQQAQPITLSHWCLSYVDALIRDLERLSQLYKRLNKNPLGAGALAGFTWSINRELTADLLGFEGVQENTLDAVSCRGEFEAELISILCILMIQFSRIAEDVILWSTSEFNFIQLSDKYTTGSSIMPQKKNPDIAELIRGRAARLIGDLCSVMSVIKGLPTGYNRDFQETKRLLFDSVDVALASVNILSKMMNSVKVNKERMLTSVEEGFTSAVDVSDLLVKKGIPFRTAYQVTGRLVNILLKQGRRLKDLKTSELTELVYSETGLKIDLNESELHTVLNPLENIKRKNHLGGPAPSENIRMRIDRLNRIKEFEELTGRLKKTLKEKYDKLLEEINRIISSP